MFDVWNKLEALDAKAGQGGASLRVPRSIGRPTIKPPPADPPEETADDPLGFQLD